MGFLGRTGGAEDDDEPGLRGTDPIAGVSGGVSRRAGPGSAFTSGLSVKEFALLRGAGPQPLAQVMGASVVRAGWQYLPALPPGTRSGTHTTGFGALGPGAVPAGMSGYGAMYTEPSPQQISGYMWGVDVMCELEMLSDAWNLARRQAIDRLRHEAVQVGADAVVGVCLDRSDHDLGGGLLEYAVSGTAVRILGQEPTDSPTLTDLSGQDYWQLRQGGFEPAGLLASTSVTFCSAARSTRLRRRRTTTRVQELVEIGEAFQAARANVRSAMRDQVSRCGGTTAVGVEFSHAISHETLELGSSLASSSRQGWHLSRVGIPYRVKGSGLAKRRGWMITMHGAGTAVRPAERPAAAPVKTTIRLGAR